MDQKSHKFTEWTLSRKKKQTGQQEFYNISWKRQEAFLKMTQKNKTKTN